MTSSTRYALDDAIHAYGKAKELRATAESDAMRELAKCEVTRSWTVVADMLDAIQRTSKAHA